MKEPNVSYSLQVAFHATAALRQYFRAHLVLHVANIRQRQLCVSPGKQVCQPFRISDLPASHTHPHQAVSDVMLL